MGGSSRSRSSNTTTTTNNTNEFTFNNVDNRIAEDNAFIGGNQNISAGGDIVGSTITQTDHGAVAGALDFAEQALVRSGSFVNETVRTSLAAISSIDRQRSQETADVIETVSELATVVQTNGESINSEFNKLALSGVLIAGLIGVGFFIWQRQKK